MKVGIVADDYKLPMFERELTAAGFVYNKSPFTNETTTLQVECSPEQVEQIRLLCVRVTAEAHKKHG